MLAVTPHHVRGSHPWSASLARAFPPKERSNGSEMERAEGLLGQCLPPEGGRRTGVNCPTQQTTTEIKAITEISGK